MISWIMEHWVDLLAVYGGLVALCSAIVKLTPTTKDDEWLNKIIKFIDKFSVVFTKKDEKVLEDAAKKGK